MEAPRPIPEAPLVASTPAPQKFDFTATVVESILDFQSTIVFGAHDPELSSSARRGPPLFVLHSSFLN